MEPSSHLILHLTPKAEIEKGITVISRGEGGQFVALYPEEDMVVTVSSNSKFPLPEVNGYEPLFRLVAESVLEEGEDPDQTGPGEPERHGAGLGRAGRPLPGGRTAPPADPGSLDPAHGPAGGSPVRGAVGSHLRHRGVQQRTNMMTHACADIQTL